MWRRSASNCDGGTCDHRDRQPVHAKQGGSRPATGARPLSRGGGVPQTGALMFWPVFLLVVGLMVLLMLWRWGTFTPAGVRAWRRIGAHHRLTDDRPLEERVGDRIPSLARLFRETSVPRLLRIAN